MKTEGIIFDLDGTLVHTIEDIAGAANELFARHGLPEHGIDYYLKWIGNGAVKFIERAYGQPVGKEQLRAYVNEFKEIYASNLHDKSRLYEGVPALLDELVKRGVKMAILSNKPHHLTQKVASFYLSDWPFDVVFGQREEVPRKPDPAGAIEIAQIMGIDAAHILFVGDSDNDIYTGRSAGMVPVAVSWGYGRLLDEPAEGTYMMIHKPSELVAFIS
jgi:phosphoglycolate phosphatase